MPSNSAQFAAEFLTCTCCTSHAVHEQLGLGREVKVDHIVQQWDVNAAGCHICDHHHVRPPRRELANVDLTSSLQSAVSQMSQRCRTEGQLANPVLVGSLQTKLGYQPAWSTSSWT